MLSQDLQQKSFRIKHDDDKFLSKLLSKESSKSNNPSFRVYYGDVSSAVPFIWETAPGTPKHTFSDTSIPPLTPPPSYYSNNSNSATNSLSKKYSRSKIFHNLLKRMNFKKVVHVGSSPSSSSLSHNSLSSMSWSSSLQSSFSDPITLSGSVRRRRFSSWGSSIDQDYDHHEEVGSSSMCFSMITRDFGGRFHMKKALLSIVGRGSCH